MIDALPNGSLGVVAPDQLIAELSGALTDAGINARHRDADRARCRASRSCRSAW